MAAPIRKKSPAVRIVDDEPLACTGGRMRKLTRRMTSFYEQYLRQIGITLAQYSMLSHLDTEPQTLLQLADRLETDRTTLSRNLKALIDNGWVAEVAGDDARQRRLVLTASGHQFRQRSRAVWGRAQLALEAQLGRDFVANLNAQLENALARLKPALPEDN
jgi:DNA-binding MarR family transcriptional regulator